MASREDLDEPCVICGLRSGERPKLLSRQIDNRLKVLMGHLKGHFHEVDEIELREEMILSGFDLGRRLSSDYSTITQLELTHYARYFSTGKIVPNNGFKNTLRWLSENVAA
jgi:hypothetical protein